MQMIGFELILQGVADPIQCVYFDNADVASVYAHEPLCDMWASVEDMLAEYPGTTRLIGPITPIALMRAWIDDDYHNAIKQFDSQRALLDTRYVQASAQIAEYEKLVSPEARQNILASANMDSDELARIKQLQDSAAANITLISPEPEAA